MVSLPCHELFAAQDAAWREQVLPSAVTARVSVEAGVAQGWYRWLGSEGVAISLERFGASAPYETVYEQSGHHRRRGGCGSQRLAGARLNPGDRAPRQGSEGRRT